MESRRSFQAITCPTLCVTFAQDSIVPRISAAALLERIGSGEKQELHLAGGHVGAVVSKHAAKTLWPQLSAFWAKHEPAAATASQRRTRGDRPTATR